MNQFLRRSFVRLSSGAIVAGKASKDYLLNLGADPGKIWVAPNAIDTEFYASRVRSLASGRELAKKERKLPKQNLMYAGRLVHGKGVYDLLRAYSSLLAEMPDVGLFLCGEGSERAALQEYCRRGRLQNVVLPGFLNREELVGYYALADVFVLPSLTEPWGLVVNEAMTCGLPVVCSSRVGAAPDLVHAGENGFIYEPGDLQTLCKHLKGLLSNPEQMKRFGEASKRIVQDYSPSRCAEGFRRAVLEA